MSKKIYVGNLSFSTTEETLRDLFSTYGEVISATVIKDKVTEQSKGFGFVELENDEGALKAVAALTGRELDGRRIRVSEAEERRSAFDRPKTDGNGRNNGRFGRRNYGNRSGNSSRFQKQDSVSDNEY